MWQGVLASTHHKAYLCWRWQCCFQLMYPLIFVPTISKSIAKIFTGNFWNAPEHMFSEWTWVNSCVVLFWEALFWRQFHLRRTSSRGPFSGHGWVVLWYLKRSWSSPSKSIWTATKSALFERLGVSEDTLTFLSKKYWCISGSSCHLFLKGKDFPSPNLSQCFCFLWRLWMHFRCLSLQDWFFLFRKYLCLQNCCFVPRFHCLTFPSDVFLDLGVR